MRGEETTQHDGQAFLLRRQQHHQPRRTWKQNRFSKSWPRSISWIIYHTHHLGYERDTLKPGLVLCVSAAGNWRNFRDEAIRVQVHEIGVSRVQARQFDCILAGTSLPKKPGWSQIDEASLENTCNQNKFTPWQNTWSEVPWLVKNDLSPYYLLCLGCEPKSHSGLLEPTTLDADDDDDDANDDECGVPW